MKATNERNFAWIVKGGCIAIAIAVAVILAGCGSGKKEAKNELNVKVINTNGIVREDMVAKAIEQFSQANSGVIVHCTPETVASDITPEDLALQLTDCDAVIFSSLLNEKLRSQTSLFYPIQKRDVEVPPILDVAYAGSTESSFWAMPLLIDPTMMFVKKSNPNDDYSPGDFQSILVRAQMMDKPQPYFVFLTGNPMGLADGIATQQLSYGYEREALHRTPPDVSLTDEEKKGVLSRSLANMKLLMTGSVEERLSEVPQSKDLETFIKSDAYAAYGRYSEYAQLPEDMQNSLFTREPLRNGAPAVPCYAIAVGIPIQAANPALAEKWIDFLLNQMESMSIDQGYLPGMLPANPDQGIGVFARNAAFVPRENSGALSEKIVIDAINGDLGIEEFNRLWRTSYFIPPANL